MRLVYTSTARKRLRNILEYIRSEHSEKRASTFQKRVLDRSEELLDHPLKGHPIPTLATPERAYRGLSFGRHLTIYHVDNDHIHVTDFFDTKQHPARMRG